MASTATALGLEQVRRRKGVSLQQIAETTKISIFFLQAIESEDFGKLPGGLFNRSYIRQYAGTVGISDAQLLDAYAEYEAELAAKEQANTPPAARPTGFRWIASLLASVVN
jgi:cytoskeleton protein RodZ